MPKRILLADDSITIQKVVELTFSDGDYEVTAVNNGARAIQKLGEMRPDIILSDIIMPERNGYEVCEYVKSHPEHRNIPVVLLTGTFEPFDPDRAEKAGCDAVVTKPFESQSLILKVEELIAQARANSAAAPAPAAPAPSHSPWTDESPAASAAPSPFTTSGGSFPTPDEAFAHDADIFGSVSTPEPAAGMHFDEPQTEAPFDTPAGGEAFAGETQAFTKMSFADLQSMAPAPEPANAGEPDPAPWNVPAPEPEMPAWDTPAPEARQPAWDAREPEAPAWKDPMPSQPWENAPTEESQPPAAEPLPWDDQQDVSGETRAFGKMSFADLQAMAGEATPTRTVDTPFGAPTPAEAFSTQDEPTPDVPQNNDTQVAPAVSPWDEPSTPFAAPPPAEDPFSSGATRAFPQITPDLMQQHASGGPAPASPEVSPWDDEPVAVDEPAIDSLDAVQAAPEATSFDETAAQGASADAAPWEEAAAPAWSPNAAANAAGHSQAESSTSAASTFAEASAAPLPEDVTFASEGALEPETETAAESVPESVEDLWPAPAAAAPEEEAQPVAVVPQPDFTPETTANPLRSPDLSDEQVDRIARRVVELMSETVVRNIAWEVIPDLAEMVVKERIRQLESEN